MVPTALSTAVHLTRPEGRVFAVDRRLAGYTVVELVVVLVLMGIIAANAMPRFFTTSRFDEMGFADGTVTALRYARKLAVASRCDTRAEVGAFGYRLWQRADSCGSGAFTRPVSRPGGTTWSSSAPSGVAPGALDIYFDAAGQPFDSASATRLTTASVIAIGSRSFTLEPVSGFVH